MQDGDHGLGWLEVGDLLEAPPFPAREEGASIDLLLSSVRLHGVLSPLLVRFRADLGRHQVICGYRRLRAAREAGLDRVPVLARDLGDAEAIRCYLSENVCRRDLSDPAREKTLGELRRMRDRTGEEPPLVAGERLESSPPRVEARAGEDRLAAVLRRAGHVSRAERQLLSSLPDLDGPSEGASLLTDLVERTAHFLEDVRGAKRIEREPVEGIVDDLLALPPETWPLRAEDVYRGELTDWLPRHSLLSASLSAALAPREVTGPGARGYALAGLLHDVGMVFLDRVYTASAGRLRSGQQRELESHTRLGHALILGSGVDWAEIALVARDHHERVDGSGYPNGLRAGEIGRLVRTVALVDSYASLVGWRPHRKPLRSPLALERLARDCERGLYDPKLFPLLHVVTGLRTSAPEPSRGLVAAGSGAEGRRAEPAARRVSAEFC